MKNKFYRILSVIIAILLSFSSCGKTSVSISDDGYWVIDGERTDVSAKGQDGKDGEDGEDGKDGKNGVNGKDGDDVASLGYIVATDYVSNLGYRDVTEGIQKMIDDHPNRTIYFPDGTYLISSPILTSANPAKSVSLVFSNYATLKAATYWKGGALVSLGGGEAFNNVTKRGSNYGIDGGVFDCSGLADGVEIASGRETRLSNLSIKNCVRGIHILPGANSNSSDADIIDCNIIGNDKPESVGIYVEGHDNTFTNIRIGHCQIGVQLRSGGNSLNNIHPLYAMVNSMSYENGVGFLDEAGSNTYHYCYSDQYCTSFKTTSGGVSVMTDCWAFWWSGAGGTENAFWAVESFNSIVTNLKIGFTSGTTNSVLKYDPAKTNQGFFQNLIGYPSVFSNSDYEPFLRGSIVS